MTRQWNLGITLTAVGVLLFLGLTGVAGAQALFKGGQRNCLGGGSVQPTSAEWKTILASGEAYEAVLPDASFTFFPLGLQCEWPRANGQGSVRTTAGSWASTVFDGVFVVLTATGITLLVRSTRRMV